MLTNKTYIFAIILLIAIFSIPVFVLSGDSNSSNDEEVVIAASIFPIVDIAQNIAGEEIEIIQVLASGASPHTYDPSPRQLEELEKADLIFRIGEDFDDWVLKGSVEESKVVNLYTNVELHESDHDHNHEQEGVEEHTNEDTHGEEDKHSDEDEHSDDDEHSDEDEHIDDDEHSDEDEHNNENKHSLEGQDPHYWLTPVNAIAIAETVRDELVKIDEANKDAYLENFEIYREELEELDDYISQQFSTLEDKEIITFHEAFAYFGEEYDIEILTSIEPFAGKEPTPQYLEDVAKVIEEYEIDVLFNEPQLSNKALDTFVDQYGVEIVTLDPLGGTEARDSYVNMMKFNTNQIKQALE